MQLLQYCQQEYNRCYLRLWFLNLSLFHHLLIELSAAPSTNYDLFVITHSHKSLSQFLWICSFLFFFFTEVLWGFILPPAVSLSRILWELAFLSKKDPPLRIAKKSLIVSWWSWWESHPCLKSYWTTCSLSLLRESIRLYLVKGNPWEINWKGQRVVWLQHSLTSTQRFLLGFVGFGNILGKLLPHYKWQSHSRISYL